MRILYTNKVSPLLGGGAEARILQVGKRLVARGHSVVVVCGKTIPAMADEEVHDGVHIFNISTLPRWLLLRLSDSHRFYLSRYMFYLTIIPKLRKLLNAESFDVWRDDIAPMPLVGAHSLAQRYMSFCMRYYTTCLHPRRTATLRPRCTALSCNSSGAVWPQNGGFAPKLHQVTA